MRGDPRVRRHPRRRPAGVDSPSAEIRRRPDPPPVGIRRRPDPPSVGICPRPDLPSAGSRPRPNLPSAGSRPRPDLPSTGSHPRPDLPPVGNRRHVVWTSPRSHKRWLRPLTHLCLSFPFLLSLPQEFPTLEDALAFEEKCLIAIGLRAEDKEPTLLNDERATAELTVAEPEPPTNQNPAAFDSDYDFDPFARNTARERQESESLRPPVGPQQPVDPQPPASEKAVPSAHLRRSTRARRKPTRFSP
mmetsp:Transcript_3484/g.7803  ORF Transcript_3484/g.7803 Transcript_3484/m.7803 type:complete len:246 (+) Transcript_3484:825-1562(+)